MVFLRSLRRTSFCPQRIINAFWSHNISAIKNYTIAESNMRLATIRGHTHSTLAKWACGWPNLCSNISVLGKHLSVLWTLNGRVGHESRPHQSNADPFKWKTHPKPTAEYVTNIAQQRITNESRTPNSLRFRYAVVLHFFCLHIRLVNHLSSLRAMSRSVRQIRAKHHRFHFSIFTFNYSNDWVGWTYFCRRTPIISICGSLVSRSECKILWASPRIKIIIFNDFSNYIN